MTMRREIGTMMTAVRTAVMLAGVFLVISPASGGDEKTTVHVSVEVLGVG